jgi:DNA-binding MarR family transcriptional regulator
MVKQELMTQPATATSPTLSPTPAQEAALTVLETVPPVMRAIRSRMREGRPAGVSVPQFRALVYIRRHPGTDLSAVADHLGTSLPAASELVARMVRQDLVERETDQASRRRICLTLSPAGSSYLEAAELRTTEWLMEVLGRLDPDRLAALVAALRDLRSLATQEDESPSAAS